MRTLAPTTLVACLALAPRVFAQTAAPSSDVPPPPVAHAAPAVAEPAPSPPVPLPPAPPLPPPPPSQPTPPTGGPQPTPDVPTQAEPSPPTPLEPAPETPIEPPTETPGATTSMPTPAAMLSVNAPNDKRAAPHAANDPWQDGHALGVMAAFRGGSRVGSPSFAAQTQEKAGLGFSLAAAFRLMPEFSFGFGLDRMSLGSASSTEGESTVNAYYTLTELELGARAYPLRWNDGELFVGLHVGLAWQEVHASGLQPSVNLEPAQVFSCSDSAGPGFALGAELGAALRLTRAFWFVGNVGADAYHLTSEPVGTCAAGIGSITALSVGAGLVYAFDLGSEAKLAATPRAAAF